MEREEERQRHRESGEAIWWSFHESAVGHPSTKFASNNACTPRAFCDVIL